MPRKVTDDYPENVRRAPGYFRRGLTRPIDPVPFNEPDRPTLVTGSGSSCNMASLLSDLLSRRGRQARAVYPYELTRHGHLDDRHGHLDDRTVVCISQSGETTDIVDAVRRADDAGCRTVGVTANPDSSLGDRVGHLIEFEPPDEYILSRSCGVLSCLARLLALYRSLGGSLPEGWPSGGVERVGSTIEDRLSSDADVGMADHYVFLAGGSLRPIAEESALSVQEATFRSASAYDVKNFAHGRAFRYSESAEAAFVLLEARDDDTAVFDAAGSMLSSLGQESVRVSSEFEQPWAAADVLAWSLAFSAQLNESVGLDLANPPGLETVRTLLDHHTSPTR